MNTIAIANQKNGLGKTTTALNIGAFMCELDYRVLLLDLDPQAHLTMATRPRHDGHPLADVIGSVKAEQLQLSEGARSIDDRLDLAPTYLSLSLAELMLSDRRGSGALLKKVLLSLATAGAYDVALIDCGPNLGLLTINALAAVQALLTPTRPTSADLSGLRLYLQSLEMIRSELTPEVEVLGVVVTQYDDRTPLHQAPFKTIGGAGMPPLPSGVDKSVESIPRLRAGQPMTAGTLTNQYLTIAREVNIWLQTRRTINN